jgi:hypothetical protein
LKIFRWLQKLSWNTFFINNWLPKNSVILAKTPIFHNYFLHKWLYILHQNRCIHWFMFPFFCFIWCLNLESKENVWTYFWWFFARKSVWNDKKFEKKVVLILPSVEFGIVSAILPFITFFLFISRPNFSLLLNFSLRNKTINRKGFFDSYIKVSIRFDFFVPLELFLF